MPDQRVTSSTLSTIVQALEGDHGVPWNDRCGMERLGLWGDGAAGEGV